MVWWAIPVLAIALWTVGCHDWEGDTTSVRVENDLNTSVRLRICRSNDCGDGFHPVDETVDPGEDTSFNVTAEGIAHVYLVESPDEEARYGCLPFVAPKWKPEITVRVSEHVPCRDEIDEDRFWPPRWASAVDPS
jgi:hypothetical protein